MEIFIKRFLKYNKSLVTVIGLSLVVVLFLLIIAVSKYIDMLKANEEVNKMRNTIVDLQDENKNAVAVIAGNLDRLKQDYDTYKKQNANIRHYFGQPYTKAIDAMAKGMGFKSGDEFTEKFYAFLNENQRERVYDRYKRFKMQYGAKWSNAQKLFIKEAQKVSFEKITSVNVDDILLQALGLPRDMSGRSQEHCADVIKNAEIQLNKFVLDKNIDINQGAASFTLTAPGLSTPEQIANSMQNMEIVGDMIPRLLKNVSKDRNVDYLKVIDSISFVGKSKYRHDQRFHIYKYKLRFLLTMSALRDIIKNINESIQDSRVYILRDLKMKVALNDDQAASVIGLVEAPVLRDKDGKVIEIKYRDDSHLAVHLRRDYGKVYIGSNPFFYVDMELDYMMLKLYDFTGR